MTAHRGAFEYDWRTRFREPLSSVPECIGWGEAWRLFVELMGDPSSHVAASVAGWQYPLSREGIALLDLFDMTGRASWGKKHKAHPRPWDDPPKKFGTGRKTKTQWAEFKARKQAEFRRRRG